MRRWNGWGDESIHYPLQETAKEHLVSIIGRTNPTPDQSLDRVLVSIPDSTLPTHPLVSIDAQDRLRHARGQSLPDWIAMRSGNIGAFPCGVAYPTSNDEIRKILGFAREHGLKIIPYGGGTSVVGHINPRPDDDQVLTVDLSRMNKLIHLDETSLLATFDAGVSGSELESQLNSHGYTLGHFPQSFELSTLGGWIATRSCGQQSYHYGRIEDLFAGGKVETPIGSLTLPPLPASAAGPDIKHLILGSEGRLGIITQATVRIRRLPETERFYGVFFHEWEAGINAVRMIVQEGVQVSMLRLSDPQETKTTLLLSGKDDLVQWADRALNLLGYGKNRCLLIFGITGDYKSAKLARRQTNSIVRLFGGLPTGKVIGSIWRKSRFKTPYLRNTLWELGYALDTIETAVPWVKVFHLAQTVTETLRYGLAELDERVLAFSHLSHVYIDGASIYVTYLFRRAEDPEETLQRWKHLKRITSESIIAHGGTISHQHGVGNDHVPYLLSEKSQVGMTILETVQKKLDPDGLLNPGKLLV